MRILWSSELKIVTNNLTGKKRYYIKVFDRWKHVSKKTYWDRSEDGNRHDTFSSITKGNLTHQSVIVYGTYLTTKGE